MKKALMLVALTALTSGCGLKLVSKEDMLANLQQAQTGVVMARSEFCSDYVTQQIENVNLKIQELIAIFE